MTANRSINRFESYYYSEILLPKLKVLYNCCVPCIANHYLRKPEKVTKLVVLVKNTTKAMSIYIVAMHTAVTVRCLEKFLFIRMNIVSETGIVSLSGNRSHYVACVKSRPIKGILKRKLMEELQH